MPRPGVVADEEVGPVDQGGQIEEAGRLQEMAVGGEPLLQSCGEVFFRLAVQDQDSATPPLQLVRKVQEARLGPALAAPAAARVERNHGGLQPELPPQQFGVGAVLAAEPDPGNRVGNGDPVPMQRL